MISQYSYPNDAEVVQLDAEKAFNSLTKNQKLYAHYLSKASWFGSLIVLFQTSPESPLIFSIFHRLFSTQSISELKSLAINKAKFDENEWKALLVYFSGFLANMGNYKGTGATKIVPNLSKDKFERFITQTNIYRTNSKFKNDWIQIKNSLFSLKQNELTLGFSPKGTTTYFSKNCTEEDSKTVDQLLSKNNIEVWNSRVFKNSSTKNYDIRFASILKTEDKEDRDYLIIKNKELNGYKFVLSRGDYSPILEMVNKYLSKAKQFCSNETEYAMITEYERHFRTGSLIAHKNGTKEWIKNKGPIVETYIGFIENYRDPAGQRAEFEGFVAMVNKEMTKKFSILVENAETLLPLLPWKESFEKDVFSKPDFTSLDVLTYTGSTIFAGINIPNYDDIRQTFGFKNFSLRNVITAIYRQTKPDFVNSEDSLLLQKYYTQTFEIQIGLHELLGHGSGKLFREDNGILNFDKNKVLNPLNGQKIDKWYKTGETYYSKFGSMGTSYDECRSECVGLILCLEPNVLKIFGIESLDEQKHIIYVNFLQMALSGIQALNNYSPENKAWLQAHARGRYVILRVLLESDKDLIKISKTVSSDGKPDLLIDLNENLIERKGKKAIQEFLLKLQVYKSMGDIKSAKEMYEKYSEVFDDWEYPFIEFRQIVLNRIKPRKLLVDSSTYFKSDKSIGLKSYEPTHEGMIKSFLDHFNDEKDLDKIIENLWQKNKTYFNQ